MSKDFLSSIEQDLTMISAQVQSQMRAVAGDTRCSSCLQPIVASLNSNIYRVITKIRSHLMAHSLYSQLKDKISALQRSYLDGDITKETYLNQRSCFNYYLSEIDNKFREMNETEVPNALVISVLRRQLNNVEQSILLKTNDKLVAERELLISLLPKFASIEEVNQMVMSCIEANPGYKYGDIRSYVMDRLFCKEEDLASAIKERLRERSSTPVKS